MKRVGVSVVLLFAALACSSRDEPGTEQSAPDASTADAQDAPIDGGPTEVTDQRAALLQAKLDQAVVDLALPGAAMGVVYRRSNEIWTGASGLANTANNEAWISNRAFRIGSVTKTFTTAAIFSLIEDGTLSLDDLLERWVPDYFSGLGVTLRHLLTHTSGIVSYNYVGSFDDSRPWTPDELVEWAESNEPALRFPPGTQWEYSNTNYVLLGMVIERASNASYESVITDRFLHPLGLHDTYVAASGDTNSNIVQSYDEAGNPLTVDPSFGWAAGAMVSTPRDLARWCAALFGGDVLAPSSLATMVTPVMLPNANNGGHGVFVELDNTDALYGHTGGIGGFLTYMYYWKTDDIALVAVANIKRVELRTLAGYGWSAVLGFDFP